MAYSERLTVPWRWWMVSALFLASLWVAYVAWTGYVWALLVTGAGALITAGVLIGYGSARIRVADCVLEAGRAVIPLSAVGTVRALSAEEARELRGPKADPRAYLLLRAYLPRAVYVEVADPADPTPYWYLSTRRPDELVAALVAARACAR